jgi:hypothetical protein
MPFDGTSFREPRPPRRSDTRVRAILAGWRPIDRCPHDRGAFVRAARALSRRLARRSG